MLERERKYLVRQLPDVTTKDRIKILQGYFTDYGGDASDPLRIRAADGFFDLTKKVSVIPGNYGLAEELTIPLSKEEFNVLWPHACYKLEKDRYELKLAGGLLAELDIFAGKLTGFTQVEVEFPDEQSEQEFEPPGWFGADITNQSWAWNHHYAKTDWISLKRIISTVTAS